MSMAEGTAGPFQTKRVRDGKTHNGQNISQWQTAVRLANLSSPQIGENDGQSPQSLNIR